MLEIITILFLILFILITLTSLVIEIAVDSHEKKEPTFFFFKLSILKVLSRGISIIRFFCASILIPLFGILILRKYDEISLLAKILSMAMVIFGIYLLFRALKLLTLFKEYYKSDIDKSVVINKNEKKIIVKQNANELELKFSELKKIEIHLSSANIKNPIIDYEYSKLITNENVEIIITSLLIKPENFRDMLINYNPKTFIKETNYLSKN